MSPRASLSHVASPRECDTRQMTSFGATEHATPDATTTRKLPSVRDLARDRLARQASDKELESRATALRQAIHRCCDARGDDDVNRVGLLRECGELPPDGQADMLEHFERETMRYRPRVGQSVRDRPRQSLVEQRDLSGYRLPRVPLQNP